MRKLDPTVAKALVEVPKMALPGDRGTYANCRHNRQWLDAAGWSAFMAPTISSAHHQRLRPWRQPKRDAIYPTSETDATGQPYSGINQYVIHFAKGELPPVDAFGR